MFPINQFTTPFGEIQLFESSGNHQFPKPRSYDDRGRMYTIGTNSDESIAIDVERYTQEIPGVFLEYISENEGPIEFFSKWTIAEVMSKLTDTPILWRLKNHELYRFPLEKKFIIEEDGKKYEGITCQFQEEEIIISIIKIVF